MNIAIVGAGISGVSAAHALDSRHNVTIFESKSSIGGHSYTVSVDRETCVDIGFIVFNDRNYPGFSKFLDDLRVRISRSPMSFSYCDPDLGIEYAGTLKGLFPTGKAILNPKHIGLIWSIYKYSRKLDKLKDHPFLVQYSIADLLRQLGCPVRTIESYFLP